MSKLTEFQIYATIRGCEATAEKHERAGRPKAAKAARQRAAGYRRELEERFNAALAEGRSLTVAAPLAAAPVVAA